MNIAFSTILLFIILAPGFIARGAYNSSKLSVNDVNKNIVNELTWSIIPSLTLHTIFIAIIHNTTHYYIDFKQLGNLILGVTTSNKVEQSFEQLGDFKYAIFSYNFILFIFSFGVGYIFRWFIRSFAIDRKIRYFRFSNKWHYIFTGECLDFKDVPDKYEEITDKIINILCKVNGKSVLYTGEYFNYYIDSKGDLEAVHLRNPIRRYLDKDDATDQDYYVIPSRYLVIPNSDIININFRYFSLEEVIEPTEEEIEKAITLDNENINLIYGEWINYYNTKQIKQLKIEKFRFFIDNEEFKLSLNGVIKGHFLLDAIYYVRDIKNDTIILGKNLSHILPYDENNKEDWEVKLKRK